MEEDFDCPLCMEEMDATDRHLKPCQCGYQICVWCFHQVMELAAKENTEGRCPACRTPYDKDKIVGTRLSCSELEFVDKKKSHKAKAKGHEGRKHLSNVRVVQRNLVYIVGFPLSLADEETLERRDFLGQYGKILKVAVSRQNTHNGPSASVYVTYVKEEDAVRCINSVDGCIFEGRLLRACFGTNKYCNSWLKNMPCNNPDCLYLHDEGPDEDSYTKEEMIANKIQFNDLTKPPHRAAGVLPAPAPEASSSTSPSTQNQQTPSKTPISKPNASPLVKVPSLPPAAAWGMRGTASKTVNKVSVLGTKRKPAADIKTEISAHKDVEEPESILPATLETDEYSFVGPGQSEVVADSSQVNTSSNQTVGTSLDLHYEGDPPYTQESSTCDTPGLLNVGDLSISIGSQVPNGHALSTDVLSPGDAEKGSVITSLERLDIGVQDTQTNGVGIPSSKSKNLRPTGNEPAENNIIADILTMDFSEDGASPGDLTKLFLTGKTTPKQSEEFLDTPWKKHQSRFSFARQEGTGFESSTSNQHAVDSHLEGFPMERDLLSRSHSMAAADPGYSSTLKSRLFAPPGFSGTSVPPPGFSLRSSNSTPASPAGNRLSEFDLIDPAIMAVGRVPLQNEISRTMRVQHKAAMRQFMPPMESDGILGLELMQQQQQQQQGFLEFGNLIKQQQQRHDPRKVPQSNIPKYPVEDFSSILHHADLGSLARHYENSSLSPYSPGSARNYRAVDNSWVGPYSAEALAKLKRGGVGLSNSAVPNSMRPGDGDNLFFSNGSQAFDHYMGGEQSFQTDIQGAFV